MGAYFLSNSLHSNDRKYISSEKEMGPRAMVPKQTMVKLIGVYNDNRVVLLYIVYM